MSDTLYMVIPGCPVPKGRPMFSRGHAFTPPKTRKYEALVATIGKIHLSSDLYGKMLEGDLWMKMEFYVPNKIRRDGGNMAKAIEDALNEIVYADDSQVKSCYWSVDLDKENPRAEVSIGRRK